MTREMDAAVITACQEGVVTPLPMAKLEFGSGTVYTHMGVGNITYDGNTYTGVGNFAGLSGIEETSELQANGIVLSLSGVDASNISIALGEHYQGRNATVYLGLLDNDTLQLVNPPFVCSKGRMDTQNIKLGRQGLIELTVENPMADWQRPEVRRYNDEDQQAKYPGDLGMQYVTQAVNKEIPWGL